MTEAADATPENFVLHAPFPNPFNAAITLRYELATEGDVELALYNLAGGRVHTLVNQQHRGAGRYDAVWDGLDERPRVAASGVYLVRLRVEGQHLDRKVMLLR